MLMLGAVVLLNSTKMLLVGVFIVFMHDYGHYVSLRESVTFFIASHCRVTPSGGSRSSCLSRNGPQALSRDATEAHARPRTRLHDAQQPPPLA